MTISNDVLVVVPAFNAQRTLGAALQSVLEQSFSNWVCVVVDDGSTDATAEVARAYCALDPRFQLLQRANGGISAARNTAMTSVSADYYAFLDADDLWLPTKLESQVAIAERHNADLVACAFSKFDDKHSQEPDTWESVEPLGFLSGDQFLLALVRGTPIRPSCVLIRKRLYLTVGGFDESLKAAEDTDYWMRACGAERCSVYRMPERLCRYRLTADSHSCNHALGFWSHMQVLPRYLTLDRVPRSERVKAFRLWFRNSFTLEGDRRQWDQLSAMFNAYQAEDPDGTACRIMAILHHVLPLKLFWLVSRYLVIPLAWHIEGWCNR